MTVRNRQIALRGTLATVWLFANIATAGIVISARRLEDMPRLMLNVNAPAGRVDALAFSADSKRLFAGSRDKMVHVWELTDVGADGSPKAVHVKTLHWEIARGMRGVISHVAVSPIDQRIAIAGFSARSTSGDIVVYDWAKGEVETSIREHSEKIGGLSASPDGKRMASSGLDGEIRVHDVGTWTSKLVRPASKDGTFPRPTAFVGSNKLVTVGPKTGDQSTMLLFDLSAAPPAEKSMGAQRNNLSIISVCGDPEGKFFVTCDTGGNLYRWDAQGDSEPKLLHSGIPSKAIALGGNGMLFVATELAEKDGRAGGTIQIFNVETGLEIDQFETSKVWSNSCVAVSSDGRFAACSGATPFEVIVFSLKSTNGQSLEKPLTDSKKTHMRNRSRTPLKVAFADDRSYRLAFGSMQKTPDEYNNHADVEKEFDFSKYQIAPLAKPGAWKNADIDDWKVEVASDRKALKLTGPGEPVRAIRLDPNSPERIFSYCWLIDDSKKPYAMAVGTDVQNAIYVYGLTAGADCPLLRYYRDHADWITSLSVSANGKYLASSSADLTIKLWNLEGLQTALVAQRAIVRQGRTFAKQAAWGANFEIRNGGVIVTSITPAGIASSRGLRVGDVVAEALVGRIAAKAMGREGNTLLATTAEDILAALEATPINEQILLTLRRLGRPLPQQILMVPAWEPTLTFFADERGEWAAWTPAGYYAASVHGDELFGWQINRGVNAKPDFYRADQFRGSLERPDMMKQLLAKGSTTAALLAVNQSVPEALDSVINNAADSVALVTIVDPPDGKSVGGQPVRVIAKIAYRDGRPVGDTHAKAYINGVPILDRKVTKDDDSATVEWTVTPPDPFSRVRVVASKQEKSESANYAFADVHVRSIDIKRKPRLHTVSLAAGDYPGKFKLDFPVADAEAVIEKLWQGKQGLYEAGFVRKLYNQDVSRAGLAKLIENVKSELGNAPSGDLLVVFLAGHGIAFGNEYYFIPPDSRLSDVSSEKAESLVKEVGITWTQLRELSTLPCRKVFFLDTCFAGNTLLQDGTNQPMKSAIRPLSRDEVLVLAATAENQSALESASLGHGVFSKCLLDGLSGKALRDNSTDIDLGGVSNYLEKQVPQMTEQRQTPRSSPTDLLDLIFIPLVRSAATPKVESFKLK